MTVEQAQTVVLALSGDVLRHEAAEREAVARRDWERAAEHAAHKVFAAEMRDLAEASAIGFLRGEGAGLT